jgi:hypothetical protein
MLSSLVLLLLLLLSARVTCVTLCACAWFASANARVRGVKVTK